ncbi:DUF6225 family protein [Streptomyces sp. NBC_00091]|uniref:DUF6225 family protein n=1 Tax=Streptomyces sp. NBC_00091 TaxID=2975648 RepID=UPI00225BDB7F|nr:DUF6225 family protein [Streptomyces sp. NBC_00091]MCX5380345.1 DUF6225 family protein [Streptomyces sp. NBC_00091]
MAEMFEHIPHVWTAARLREALADLPDETPIHIGVADGPGDFEGYGEYVLVEAEPVEMDVSASGAAEVRFTLFADARAGAYYLDTD